MTTQNQINPEGKHPHERDLPLSADPNALIARNTELQELYNQLQESNEALRVVHQLLKVQNERLQWKLNQHLE